MIEGVTAWVWSNKVELFGALLGLAYIFFSIRRHILTWPVGLITSVLYIIVFFRSGFYADMGLQVYYVFISIYGWYIWAKGNNSSNQDKIPVRHCKRKLWIIITIVTIAVYFIILFVLKNYTDSTVPFMDSLTTALSITATWMLARKYIEHWLIWIFVDLVSVGLYVYKGLWPTVVLFVVYTVMAAIGFIEWRNNLKNNYVPSH